MATKNIYSVSSPFPYQICVLPN